MNGKVAPPAAAASSTPSKVLGVALWVVQILLALVYLGASSGKLLGRPEVVAVFATIGLGQWFRVLTGVLELSGALLIVPPKTRFFGAALLACVMLGATTTHLFVLHNSPAAPLVLLALLAFVMWGRRGDAAKLLGR